MASKFRLGMVAFRQKTLPSVAVKNRWTASDDGATAPGVVAG
jgi:hypothetical protein